MDNVIIGDQSRHTRGHLDHNIPEHLGKSKRAGKIHCRRNGGVHESTTQIPYHEKDKGESEANNNGVASGGEDHEDKEECAEELKEQFHGKHYRVCILIDGAGFLESYFHLYSARRFFRCRVFLAFGFLEADVISSLLLLFVPLFVSPFPDTGPSSPRKGLI